MFSEYASRFLAQSQSRLSLNQEQNNAPRNPLGRQRGAQQQQQRGYLPRQPFGNPYQSATQTSRFPFASRLSTTSNNPAPLFYSATDEFQDEDDGEEHEREVADFYALQRSRRDVDAGRLTDSSELEDEDGVGHAQTAKHTKKNSGDVKRARGIKSSWTGDEETPKATADTAKRKPTDTESGFVRPRDRLVDVELASTIHEEEDDGFSEVEENPPSMQQFHRPPGVQSKVYGSEYEPRETDAMIHDDRPGQSMLRESVPTTLPQTQSDPPRHDIFWGTAFLICVAAMFATFVLVCLHTTAPKNTGSLGDTVYTALRSSFYLLAVDTTIATFVALIWLALLRSFVRPLVVTILIAVPVIMFSFTLYPFISSFKGRWGGSSTQDKAMRWLAFLPGTFGAIWTYTAYKGRHQFGKGIGLLEFATRILAENAPLILVGFGNLGATIVWSWLWLLMFTRVFLGGHTANGGVTGFVIDAATWWIGAFFILIYLWGLGVISGIQRATTGATVSQWYFHRLTVPSIAPQRVVMASLTHAVTTIFGTICASALLSLAIRLPLLVLPGRLCRYIAFFFYSFIPTSIATLTNPLTLTYAAIHSQNLTSSARGTAEMVFVSDTSPTTTLTPRSFSRSNSAAAPSSSIYSYRLAKLFLFATRAIASVAFGFAGWVSTARRLQVEGAGVRGSLYAYIVGFVAAAIGWAVLGAMEGVLGGILDAVAVCWGSEVGREGTGQARYCREAGELLADEG